MFANLAFHPRQSTVPNLEFFECLQVRIQLAFFRGGNLAVHSFDVIYHEVEKIFLCAESGGTLATG